MIKDRIIEIGTKRVLLPERCTGPSESYSVKELLAILASDRHSVLITGETGTGKEMLADVVMQMTQRPKGKCQRLNCAGLDSNLVGSELFGHKKGSFTGAESNRDGLLKTCDGGVLFLDEIGWLLPDLQARLLRFMETGEIRPIGADKIEQHADVRIVAATNKDINDDKVMIPDLRARFDFEVHLPPLRERVGDILWFLCEPGFLGGGEIFTGITLRTLIGILTNEWSGNIRELKKYCQRKVTLNPITKQDNEKRHILEDWHFGNFNTIESVKGFAGLALSVYETYGKTTESARLAESARRVAALLAGLFGGMDGWLCANDKPVAVIPFAVLEAAVNGKLPNCEDFDVMTALIKAFEVVDPGVVGLVNVAILLYVHKAKGIDLADALSMVLRVAKAVAEKKPSALTCTGTVKGKLANVPVGPSQAFLDEIGTAGPGGVLFAVPTPPKDGSGIEQALDQLGIKDPDRSIAILCNRGLSQKDISQHVGLKPTAVGEHLVKLRREEKLKAYLPKQMAGRKPKRPPN